MRHDLDAWHYDAPDLGPVPERLVVEADTVRQLVAEQFPQWAHLPVEAVRPGGWDNCTFRLGDHVLARLPSAAEYALAVPKEHQWLPELAARRAQQCARRGRARRGPCRFPGCSARRRRHGRTTPGHPQLVPRRHAAHLRRHGPQRPGRAPGAGRLTAIIDFGTCGVGDPSCDLAIAWTLLDDHGRRILRGRLGIDDMTWSRGRGWALWKALSGLAGAVDDGDADEAAREQRIVAAIVEDFIGASQS